jgi:hypothetical protein
VPPEQVAEALEKHVAKMEDVTLTSLLLGALEAMPNDARRSLAASIFDAFRDRGESSDDVAEGADTTVAAIESAEVAPLVALIRYSGENTGLLKEALTLLAHEHSGALAALPRELLDGISARL